MLVVLIAPKATSVPVLVMIPIESEISHLPTFGLWSLVRNATGTLIVVITSATSGVSHAQTMQTFTVLMVSTQLRCRHEGR